jgi:ATP synthase protein I
MADGGTVSKDSNQRLQEEVRKRVRRMERKERERPDLLGEAAFLGTIAGLFVVPVVAGAYIGLWLDEMQSGFSTHWTFALILAGVVIGAINVYLYLWKDQ